MMMKVPDAQMVSVVLIVLVLAASAGFFLNRAYPFQQEYDICRQAKLAGGTGDNTNTAPLASAAESSPSSEPTLLSILEAAAMPNKTVILAPLNEAWSVNGSVLDYFFESFRIGIQTERLLDHLVIVALDLKAYARCKLLHKHCLFLETPGANFSEEKVFMSDDYLKLVWRKIEYLAMILEIGYSFVFTDVDIMWLRDPFPDLLSDAGATVDVTAACDHYLGNPNDVLNTANTGFQYVRANYRTMALYRYWYKSRESHPGLHDQDVFNIIKGDNFVNTLGVKFRFLDTTYYGGLCEVSKDPSQLRTMHATCCIGEQNKLRDLRLVLDDWRNFTSAVRDEDGHKSDGGNGSRNSSSFPWRFPTAKICG